VSAPVAARSNPAIIKKLCGACGLCCNGAIFADVQLRLGDNKSRLQSLGLGIIRTRRISKLVQPCAAHDGCSCLIYSERPVYCQKFECALLKRVCRGGIDKVAALKIIRKAKVELKRIDMLLLRLGNSNQHLPHRIRFEQVNLSLRETSADPLKTRLFSDLTLAVHQLDCLLAEDFYPGREKVKLDKCDKLND
jgi:uncharacterized protein